MRLEFLNIRLIIPHKKNNLRKTSEKLHVNNSCRTNCKPDSSNCSQCNQFFSHHQNFNQKKVNPMQCTGMDILVSRYFCALHCQIVSKTLENIS